jgi:GNAT superfamily N-acetyltransferase
MSEVRYREARKDDISSMVDISIESLKDMLSRNNVSAPMPPRPMLLAAYEYYLPLGIFYVAELKGQIITSAGAIVHDHIFYLMNFFARPNQQRKGIGMPLLKMVWDAGKEAGARIFCTHSSPDLTAMAAYMKLGMLPGHQVLYFGGKPNRLSSTPSGYDVVALDKRIAMEIDNEIRGTGREPDHTFWLDVAGLKGRQVLHKGKVIGYYYLGRGSIGPAAWTSSLDAEAMMTLACHEASEVAPEISFLVPGINHAVLKFALDSGVYLTSVFHFLTTAPFGKMDQYIPSGPGLY